MKFLGLLAHLSLAAALMSGCSSPSQVEFDSERSLRDLSYQVSLGPRVPTSSAHLQTGEWISTTLSDNGWKVEAQDGVLEGHEIKNIVAKKGAGTPWVILGAHYDTRMASDRDPNVNQRSKPGPGANDGASGVAVLTELSRTIPKNLPFSVWLVFFDVEDQGNLPAWNWILGSRYFASTLNGKPDAVIILDMVADADLNIYQEGNSDPGISHSLWEAARRAGFGKQFITSKKHTLLDDHIPFKTLGIPAVDVIDFDYPYWHTTSDDLNHVSASSLKAVGQTVLNWLLTNSQRVKTQG